MKYIGLILSVLVLTACTQANTSGNHTNRAYDIKISNRGYLVLYTPLDVAASTKSGSAQDINNDPSSAIDANASLAGKGATSSLATGAAKQILEGIESISKELLKRQQVTTNTTQTTTETNEQKSEWNEKSKTEKVKTQPDKFDLSKVIWLHTDVSNWPVTATLSKVYTENNKIYLDYDKASSWPGVGEGRINANPWVIVNYHDRWYAATWEWLRQGQTAKSVSAVDGSHIKRKPLKNWHPKKGERIGFMVSGLARDLNHYSNVKERSNIYWFTWNK